MSLKVNGCLLFSHELPKEIPRDIPDKGHSPEEGRNFHVYVYHRHGSFMGILVALTGICMMGSDGYIQMY